MAGWHKLDIHHSDCIRVHEHGFRKSHSIPTRTADKVSGLPNGTYFWRVKCTQLGPNGGVDSPWSTVRSFTVTGPGPAPATPTFVTPLNNARFHVP